MQIEEIYDLVDLEQAVSAYTDPNSPTYTPLSDQEEVHVRGWIVKALETWAVKDVERWKDCTVLVEQTIIHGEFKMKAIADLVVIPKEEDILILDWKTSPGPLDANWKRKQEFSWQWRIYSLLYKAKYFSYRGLSELGSTREESFHVDEESTRMALDFLDESVYTIDRYIREGKTSWPKTWPKACFSKYEPKICQYLDDCKNNTSPTTIPRFQNMSYSRINTFWDCPEKARRQLLESQSSDSRLVQIQDPAILRKGKAFHAGIAEIYKQLFPLR